jgi:hypothetical protein
MLPRAPQPEHEQHGLVPHLAQFGGQDEPALGNLAQSRHDGDILPAARLKGNWRSVEAASDIDLPQLLEAHVVIGSERSIAKAGEHEAAGCRECSAVVGIGYAHPVLDLAGKRIGGDDVGFSPRQKLDPAAQHRPGGRVPELVRGHRDFIARSARWNVEQPRPQAIRRRPVIVAALVRWAQLLGAVRQCLILQA